MLPQRSLEEKETTIVPSEEKQTTPHIQVIDGNSQGCDHIFGDIHGSLAAFKEALAKGKVDFDHGDRVLCVGDLNDKGTHSLEVIEHIIATNQKYGKTVIHVVLGNHEKMLLEFYDAHIAHQKNPSPENASALEGATNLSVANEQQWAIDLAKSDPARLERIIDYLKKLSYIMYVKPAQKNSAFIVLHADLPFSQQELHQRIRDNRLMLEVNELYHTIWAREMANPDFGWVAFSEKTANLNDDIVYCGHNVLYIRHLAGFHIDVDVATFRVNAILKVNHTNQTADVFSAPGADLQLTEQVNMVEEHVKTMLPLVRRLKMVATTLDAIKDPQLRYQFNDQEFSYAELKPEEDKHTDLALFQRKVSALETIKKVAEENINNANVTARLLEETVNEEWVKHVSVLAAEFKTAPHPHLAAKISRLMITFAAVRAQFVDETDANTVCNLTSSLRLGWFSKKNEATPFKWDELDQKKLFNVFNKILASMEPAEWEMLSSLIDDTFTDKEIFLKFVEFCASEGELSRANLFTYLVPPHTMLELEGNLRFFYHGADLHSVLDQHDQLKDLATLSQDMLFSMLHHSCGHVGFDDLDEMTLWQYCISSDDDLIKFLAYQPGNFKSICRTLLRFLPFEAFDKPANVAALLNAFPMKYQMTLLGAVVHSLKEKDPATHSAFYLELLKLRLEQLKDDKFHARIKGMVELLEKVTLDTNETLGHIYYRFIATPSIASIYEEMMDMVGVFLTEKCCTAKLNACGNPSVLVGTLEFILENEFDIAMPSKGNIPLSMIEMFSEKSHKEICDGMRALITEYGGDVEAEQQQETKETKETGKADVKATVKAALETLKKLRGKPRFFGDKAQQTRYQEFIDGLAMLHLFVPTYSTPYLLDCVYIKPRPKQEMILTLPAPK